MPGSLLQSNRGSGMFFLQYSDSSHCLSDLSLTPTVSMNLYSLNTNRYNKRRAEWCTEKKQCFLSILKFWRKADKEEKKQHTHKDAKNKCLSLRRKQQTRVYGSVSRGNPITRNTKTLICKNRQEVRNKRRWWIDSQRKNKKNKKKGRWRVTGCFKD